MIDELLYYPQFCMASVIATAVLFVMFFVKRNFASKHNTIFMIMLFNSLLSSLVNILTFYVISFPERYPVWLCYGANMVYLILYNLMAVLFLFYTDSITKIHRMLKPTMIIGSVHLSLIVVLLLTTPFTKLVVYFDEELVYRHGPLMWLLYASAFTSVALAVIMFIQKRKRFNSYQVFSITVFALGVFASVLFQSRHPKYVISNFVCAMVLFFVYMAFENQAYYLHGDTPCYNRRAFIKTINRYRKYKKNYSVVAISIENYENYANAFGRSDMDKLSERLAERLCVAFGRLAFILGGNCLAVVREGSGRTDDIIRTVRNVFLSPVAFESGGTDRRLSVKPVITSLKVREQSIGGHEMDELLRKLEVHPSQETLFIEDVSEFVAPIRREREVLGMIDRAIKNKSFEVYYQPILNVRTGRFVCSEALVRMRDEKGRFISPDEFIPIAERSGRIDEIGNFVFTEVCRFINEGRLKQLGVDYIEVNLSPEQCRNAELTNTMLKIMQKYNVSPSQLNLEITETARIENKGFNMLRNTMGDLHKQGVTFSLDDFGSGFAAINYLISLPVDIVKIDKTILWKAMVDETSMNILRDTITMIRNIGKQIVVEGIETEEMAGMLKANGCDYLQGYLYSKPLPGEQYIEFIQNAA